MDRQLTRYLLKSLSDPGSETSCKVVLQGYDVHNCYSSLTKIAIQVANIAHSEGIIQVAEAISVLDKHLWELIHVLMPQISQ